MFLFCTIASFLLKFNYPNQNRAFAVFPLCYLLIFSVTILSFLFVIIIFLSACQQYFRSALPLPFSILSLVSQVWFLLSFLFQQFFSSYFLLKKRNHFLLWANILSAYPISTFYFLPALRFFCSSFSFPLGTLSFQSVPRQPMTVPHPSCQYRVYPGLFCPYIIFPAWISSFLLVLYLICSVSQHLVINANTSSFLSIPRVSVTTSSFLVST